MRFALIPSIVVAIAYSNSASAQTTSTCNWIGNTWTCNQSAPRSSGFDWSKLNNPNDVATSAMDSFDRGVAAGERARRAKDERERHEAAMELYRAQTEAAKSQSAQTNPGANAPDANDPPEYVRNWFARAQPRMALYPDFAERVYAKDVAITPDMINLMSGSEYAADIAYYLATHKAEARAIAQISLLDAARAIDKIENEIKANPPSTSSEK